MKQESIGGTFIVTEGDVGIVLLLEMLVMVLMDIDLTFFSSMIPSYKGL